MNVGFCAIIGAAVAVCACGATHTSRTSNKPIWGSSASPEFGAGTFLYVRHQLVRVGDQPSLKLASVVIGLSDVDVLTEGPSGTFSATTISGPRLDTDSCVHTPINIAVTDVNSDNISDLVITDTCSNWAALGGENGEYLSRPLAELMPSFPPWQSFAAIRFEDGLAMLFGGSEDGGTFLTHRSSSDGFGPLSNFALRDSGMVTTSHVTQLFFAAGLDKSAPAPSIVYQGGARLQVFKRSGDGLQSTTSLQPIVHAPYVLPFDAFDHLTALPIEGCTTALGVGVFGSDVKNMPRSLQLLTLSDTTYDTRDIDTAADVVSFATVNLPTGAIVGVIERKESNSAFAAYRISGCNQIAFLGRTDIEFDWKASPAPSFTDGIVPKTDGVSLLGVTASDSLYRFFHFDGYDLRTFRVQLDDENVALISQERWRVHEARSDLAF